MVSVEADDEGSAAEVGSCLEAIIRAEPLTIGARTAFPLLANVDVKDPDVTIEIGERVHDNETSCKDEGEE